MTDIITPGHGSEAGTPEGGENKAPVQGEAPAWLKQDVVANDQEVKDPADSAGSSVLEGGDTLTDKSPAPKLKEDNADVEGSDGGDDVDDIEHKGDYVPRPENHDRRSTLTRIGVGAVAALAALGSMFMIGRSTGGEDEQKTNPEKTEEIGLPGQPEEVQPDTGAETAPNIPGLLENPYKTPSGETIDYDGRPTSLGEIKIYQSPEVLAAEETAIPVTDWIGEGPTISANTLLAGKDGAVFRGFAAHSIDVKVEGSDEVVRSWAFDILPSYNTQKTPDGRVRHAYTSLLDEDSLVSIASEGDTEDPTKFDIAAYGIQDMVVYTPETNGDVTMTVKLDKSKKPSELDNQRGDGGFVARLSGNDKPVNGEESPDLVVGRRAVVIGDLTPEQVLETGKMLLLNAGYSQAGT